MKQLFMLCGLFISQTIFAQTGGSKVDSLINKIKKQEQGKATISFIVNGKTYTDKGDMYELENGQYIIGSSLTNDNTPNTSIHLLIEKKQQGAQVLSDKKNATSLVSINGAVFEVKGTVTLKLKGKKTSGTLLGTLHELKTKSSKPVLFSSGTITATFSE